MVPYYRIKILDPLGGPKYRALRGTPNHIYFPPDLPKLLARGSHQFLLITEGEKKAAAVVKAGFPCVALSGVDNWKNRQLILPKDTQFKATKTAKSEYITAKIPAGDSNATVLQDTGVVAVGFYEFVEYMVEHRMEAIIVFDTDDGKVKPEVQRAAAMLGYELRYRGLPIVNIRQLILPGRKGEKVGIDDYLQREKLKGLAGLIRNVRKMRMAFPRHPAPKTFVASRLQKARLSRKETQDVALAVLMELETRGRRLRNINTHDTFFFSNKSHTLMDVIFNQQRVPLHDTSFGSYLYREFNLSANDQRVVLWLAAQFHGEPGIDNVVTHRVIARTPAHPNHMAYQLSDSHFVTITPNKLKPFLIYENGSQGVLFEQNQVDPIDAVELEAELEEQLERDDVYWRDALEGFSFRPAAPGSMTGEMSDAQRTERLEQGRMLAVLLYYLSPWMLRWNGTQLPVELIIGEPGSGKSSLYALRQTILTGRPRLTNMTNDIKDWYAGITSQGGLHVLDNVHFSSGSRDYQQRLSDELCRLVTEPAPHVEMRKLYTTSDILSLPVNVCFALTSIDQPFTTQDLIQRSAIFELEVISKGHDARWIENALAKGHGRVGWIAHHLATIHKFMHRAVTLRQWDPHYRAKHRLANYEQALILMAKVLRMPFEWIPNFLVSQTSSKLTESDWTLAGLGAFVAYTKEKFPNSYTTGRFGGKEICAWADTDEEYSNNRQLTNPWSLSKYMKANASKLQRIGIVSDGSQNNRQVYRIEK